MREVAPVRLAVRGEAGAGDERTRQHARVRAECDFVEVLPRVLNLDLRRFANEFGIDEAEAGVVSAVLLGAHECTLPPRRPPEDAAIE